MGGERVVVVEAVVVVAYRWVCGHVVRDRGGGDGAGASRVRALLIW